jgi:hypothetical protein
MRYQLVCVFASQQWPLREGDHLEIRTPSLEVIARIPAALLESVLAQHVDALAVQARLSQALGPVADAGVLTPAPERRAMLRAQRRSRKPGL